VRNIGGVLRVPGSIERRRSSSTALMARSNGGKDDTVAPLVKQNLEAWKDVNPPQQEGNFLDERPGESDGERLLPDAEAGCAQDIRDASPADSRELEHPVCGSLPETEASAEVKRNHGHVRARIDIHRHFELGGVG